MESWVADALEAIEHKMYVVAQRNAGRIPYTTVNGRFDDMAESNICWWTNGFWGGIMWQMYQLCQQALDGGQFSHETDCKKQDSAATTVDSMQKKQDDAIALERQQKIKSHRTLYRQLAIQNEEQLDANFLDPYGMDHDSGFKWLPTAVQHYRMDGDEAALRRGLLAAENLAGRFNPAGNFIRAWNDPNDGSSAGIAIIDCMMNLPLLYWASEQTHDPQFAQIAVRHADTVRKYFVREDGSAIHMGQFDPNTGAFLDSIGGQGYGYGSAWTRGQAWAIYGFVQSYQYTHEVKYLQTAQRVADYFLSQILESGAIPVDFYQPKDCRREDSSAAAIAACGLIELAECCLEEYGTASEVWYGKQGKYDSIVTRDLGCMSESKENHTIQRKAQKENNCKDYRREAGRLLQYLYQERCSLDPETDYLLSHCADCYHSEREQMTLIYADYYFIEALIKLERG